MGPDFTSLVMHVRLKTGQALGRTLPGWWGRAAQKVFLDAVACYDEGLSRELHPIENSGRNPYTVSSLIGYHPKNFTSRQTYSLRFTTVHSAAAEVLADAAKNGPLKPDSTLELDHLAFEIEAAVFDREQHPWAFSARWPQFIQMLERIDVAEQAQLRLLFASPTYFKTQGGQTGEYYELLPFPQLVFRGLAEMWRTHARIDLDVDFHKTADEALHLAGSYRLKTSLVQLWNEGHDSPKRAGLEGEITYDFVDHHPATKRMIFRLAYFAFLVGVGGGTTTGFGQVRVL